MKSHIILVPNQYAFPPLAGFGGEGECAGQETCSLNSLMQTYLFFLTAANRDEAPFYEQLQAAFAEQGAKVLQELGEYVYQEDFIEEKLQDISPSTRLQILRAIKKGETPFKGKGIAHLLSKNPTVDSLFLTEIPTDLSALHVDTISGIKLTVNLKTIGQTLAGNEAFYVFSIGHGPTLSTRHASTIGLRIDKERNRHWFPMTSIPSRQEEVNAIAVKLEDEIQLLLAASEKTEKKLEELYKEILKLVDTLARTEIKPVEEKGHYDFNTYLKDSLDLLINTKLFFIEFSEQILKTQTEQENEGLDKILVFIELITNQILGSQKHMAILHALQQYFLKFKKEAFHYLSIAIKPVYQPKKLFREALETGDYETLKSLICYLAQSDLDAAVKRLLSNDYVVPILDKSDQEPEFFGFKTLVLLFENGAQVPKRSELPGDSQSRLFNSLYCLIQIKQMKDIGRAITAYPIMLDQPFGTSFSISLILPYIFVEYVREQILKDALEQLPDSVSEIIHSFELPDLLEGGHFCVALYECIKALIKTLELTGECNSHDDYKMRDKFRACQILINLSSQDLIQLWNPFLSINYEDIINRKKGEWSLPVYQVPAAEKLKTRPLLAEASSEIDGIFKRNKLKPHDASLALYFLKDTKETYEWSKMFKRIEQPKPQSKVVSYLNELSSKRLKL